MPPQNEGGGGMLHLPSPTHCHHIDAASTIDQIRRSLSRSPSRRARSPKLGSPLSPSSSSPNLRSQLSGGHSPLAVPYPPSAKKNRNALRRPSPMRLAQTFSPVKRVLADRSDQGNMLPSQQSHLREPGQENASCAVAEVVPGRPSSPLDVTKANAELPDLHTQASSQLFGRKERHEFLAEPPARSSPLKRSERSGNPDLVGSGSPSAKRRSLHGASLGIDFDIFDQYTALESATMDNHDSQDATQNSVQAFSPAPKRSGSLRKTTLQQRHEKPLRLRGGGFDNPAEAQTPNPLRNRLRLSLDQYPQPPRESPFSSQGSLPNASLHPLASRQDCPVPAQRHPLSRTITQSSSSSSMVEDSPTHIPFRHVEPRQPRIDFAKSLPLHAARPTDPASTACGQTSSQESSFATPESYKLAKPLPAAFMSTGLISKKNRNIDQEQLDARGSIGHMPDTPCKRPVSLASISPSAGIQPHKADPRLNRHTMHSFGTPSTPFNPHVSSGAGSDLRRGSVIFGDGVKSSISHGEGFLADYNTGVEASPSSHASVRRNGARFKVPPTPTKATVHGPAHGQSFSTATGLRAANAEVEANIQAREFSLENDASGSSFFESSSEEEFESVSVWDQIEAPFSAQRTQRSMSSNDLLEGDTEGPSQVQSPTPRSRNFHTLPISRRRGIKHHDLEGGLGIPSNSRTSGISPKTPADMVPPDPSGLSISAQVKSQSLFAENIASNRLSLPPVTPTANRDSFPRLSRHKPTLTPIHHAPSAEIDESITSRFDKVELVGTGEFSSVFRVVRQREPGSGSGGYFTAVRAGDSLRTPTTPRVWAVKKTRNAYLGQRDRQRKMQEVDILQRLGRSDHTIHLTDSWEFGGHLYIQTEYCDEGSLDVFLEHIGRNARLDDFRIWKILLELAQGIMHIHDSGIIHLDLKPANILITFEGMLKIADFGMATSWPAAAGIDGEGDREYIAPEILQGTFDKPADVFALGLILLEIAGNVMLPENGVSWQRLRSGDMSDVPSLTSSSLSPSVPRTASGQPLQEDRSFGSLDGMHSDHNSASAFIISPTSSNTPTGKPTTFSTSRAGELLEPPAFMKDNSHEQALDALVRWMIAPEPGDRPLACQLLETAGVIWVQTRRRAGATVYEGNWGPADEVLQDDAEMIDV